MDTIKIETTWRALMPVLILCIEQGTPEGKANAKKELMDLAAKLDRLNVKAHA
jgi:hypothetical protein